MTADLAPPLAFDYKHVRIGQSLLVHADAFEWLSRLPPESLDGMVFDPPYGVKEYELDQIEMMLARGPGIWRIPPSFDGSQRAPLPRFTALDEGERKNFSPVLPRPLCCCHAGLEAGRPPLHGI